MKNTIGTDNKNKAGKPVREGKPASIADDKNMNEKKQYPFPTEQDKQYKGQPEFIDPGSNSSKNE